MFFSGVNSVHDNIMSHYVINGYLAQRMYETSRQWARASQERGQQSHTAGLPQPDRAQLLPPHALGTRCRVGGVLPRGSRSLVPASLMRSQSSFACLLVLRQSVMYLRLASNLVCSQRWSLTVQPPASKICWDCRQVPPAWFVQRWAPCTCSHLSTTMLCPGPIPSSSEWKYLLCDPIF